MIFSSASAALAMIAPDEVRISASVTGISSRFTFWATSRLLSRTARISSALRSATTLPTTLTTPVAPLAR